MLNIHVAEYSEVPAQTAMFSMADIVDFGGERLNGAFILLILFHL